MKLGKLLLVSAFMLFASWALAREDSGQDYTILLDEFVVLGPGAWVPGWFDDFDDGDLGGWVCHMGTCQDEPGTSYARLESPGRVSWLPGGSTKLSFERSDISSWLIPESYVSADGWFLGGAIFAAELPKTNESISLQLDFDIDDNGRTLHEAIIIEIGNPASYIAALRGGSVPGGLRIEQYRYVFDENWDKVEFSNWEIESLTAPENLGNVILTLRYEDGAEGPVFHAGYALTEISDISELSEPFSPIDSNLHLSNDPGSWSIRAHVTFLQNMEAYVDLDAGVCNLPDGNFDAFLTTDTKLIATQNSVTGDMHLQCRAEGVPVAADGKTAVFEGFPCGTTSPFFGLMVTQESHVVITPKGKAKMTCQFQFPQ